MSTIFKINSDPTIFRGKKINTGFLDIAETLTSFNLKDKDLQSIKYKNEIQYAYYKNFFPKLDEKWWSSLPKSSFLNSSICSTINAKMKEMKSKHRDGFNRLVQFKGQALGPGEVLMYVLHDKVYLAGGSEGGDVRIGSNKYEVKAVDLTGDKNEVYGFTLGSTIPDTEIITALLKLKKEVGKSGSSIPAKEGTIGRGDIKNMEEVYPDQIRNITKRYGELARKYYFSKYKMLFLNAASKNASKSNYGEIISFKDVQANDVRIEAYSMNQIKPFIKIK